MDVWKQWSYKLMEDNLMLLANFYWYSIGPRRRNSLDTPNWIWCTIVWTLPPGSVLERTYREERNIWVSQGIGNRVWLGYFLVANKTASLVYETLIVFNWVSIWTLLLWSPNWNGCHFVSSSTWKNIWEREKVASRNKMRIHFNSAQ